MYHIDSIIGSEAVCIAISMSLNNIDKSKIKQYIEDNYFKLDEINKELKSQKEININCIETVKKSLKAFFNSNDFEDAIRNAIALGGDSDTIAAITGGIASAYYGIPEDIYQQALQFLDSYLINIHDEFVEKFNNN